MESGYGFEHLVSVEWLRQTLKDATKVPVPPKDKKLIVSVGHADSTGPGIPKSFIPQAIFVNTDEIESWSENAPSRLGDGNLHRDEKLKSNFESMGIDVDTTVM